MHIIRTIFLTAFLLFVFLLTGNARKSNTNANLESVKYHHFLAAVTNQSTFGYFTVILVKDLNTGIVKEICTKGNFLSGAVHTELKADYDASGERNVLQLIK